MYYNEIKLKTFIQKELINKSYVHKKDEKNVLLYNLHRTLPKYLEKSLFEAFLSRLPEKDRQFIIRYYKVYRPDNIGFLKEVGKAVYVLSNYPLYLPGDVLDLENVKFLDAKKIIQEYYSKDQEHKCFVLITPLKDIDYFKILTALKMNNFYITPKDEVKLSQLFETFEELPKEDIFYSNMHVNPMHEYFFEHNIEHIPAMMLIEAQRQFGLACAHIYGKVPTREIQIILKNLNIQFNTFAELVYPVIIRGENTYTKWKNKDYWRELHMEIGIYQNINVANFNFVGKSIELKMFERFRERKYQLMNSQRFAPRSYLDYNFSLKENKRQKYINVNLQNISAGGFSICLSDYTDSSQNSNEYISNESECDFLIYSHAIGFISGKCEKVWQESCFGIKYAGYKFINLSKNDVYRIKEFISKFFFQIERREYYNQGLCD
jgi:hypothetical protein